MRHEFIDFHDKHYSANRTKLVVLGREGLDDLEEWVADMFAAMENKDLPQNRWDGPQPYAEEQLGTTIFAKPVMDTRSLEISFPYQDEEDMYETQPGRYISHLIGHEGPDSILAYLKGQGLANGLAAGASTVCPGTAFFHIQIRLTEEGLRRYKDIVQILFQYISLLKDSPPQQWVMDEIKSMAEVDFRFREKTPASAFASRMSSIMQKPLPREWLLSGLDLIRRFDSEAISKGLDYLRSDNFRLTVVSQKYPGDWNQREKWYGTEYRIERFDADFADALEKASKKSKLDRIPDLHLPHRNEFVPTNLVVEKKEVQTPATAPKLIRNDDYIRTWWKKDDTFWVPKGAINVNMRNPLTNATPACLVKSYLFCELVKDALVEYAYDAEISGLEYSLAVYPLGLGVDISGYNDKMSVLLEKVLVSMRDLEIKAERFNIVKERLMRGFRNYDFQQPYRQVGDFTGWLITAHGWIIEQYIPELEKLTIEELEKFIPQMLSQMHIVAFCHGNIYKEDALKMSDLVVSTFQHRALPPMEWQVKRNMLIPSGSDYTYRRHLGDPANVNNCIEYYLAVGPVNDRSLQAKVLLLAQLTDELGFDQLRTKEQLGYVVWTGAKMSSTTIGYRIIIQSERPTEYLEERINAFLSFFAKSLQEMSDEIFESHKRSLINKRLEKVKNLTQEHGRIWSFISSEYYDFFQRDQQAEQIQSLTKEDLTKFFNRYIDPQSPQRAKLSVHLKARTDPDKLNDATSPEEKKAKLTEVLEKFSTAMGMGVDMNELNALYQDVEFVQSRKSDIMQVYTRYLVKQNIVSEDQLSEVEDEVAKLLEALLPSLGIELKPEVDGDDDQADLPPAPPVKETTYIDDVRKYKSSLQASAGPQPVTDLLQFEDFDSKL